MRETWSVNALSIELEVDRRTVTKWLARADVKAVENGPSGPLYRLRDVVRVLCDASLFIDPERRREYNSFYYQEMAAREFTGLVLSALKKRQPESRGVREVLADELLHFVLECNMGSSEEKPYKRGPSPAWSAMSDTKLRRSLRALIDAGAYWEEELEHDAGRDDRGGDAPLE